MMNCDQLTADILNDYIDSRLDNLLRSDIAQHLTTCHLCQQEYQSLAHIVNQVNELNAPDMRPGLADQLIHTATAKTDSDLRSTHSHKARHTAKHTARHTAWGAMGGAIAASLAIWLFFSTHLVTTSTDVEKQLPSPEVIVSNQVHPIKVAINSNEAIPAVDISVQLSTNLELNGYGKRKTISWKSPLQKGVNIITLPVVGIALGEGEVITRVQLAGKEKIMRIKTRYQKHSNPRDHVIKHNDNDFAA